MHPSKNPRPFRAANHREPARFTGAVARLHGDERLWQSLRQSALARVSCDYSPRIFQEQVAAVFPATAPGREAQR